jgi:hypothetical protein
LLHVQTTVVPAATVMVEGLKLLLATVTAAVVGAVVAVAVNVKGDPVRLPADAVIVISPAVPPSVTLTPEIPAASVATVPADTVPPVAAQPTSTPGTPLPNRSATFACTGAASWVLIAPVWPLPPNGASVAAASGAAVAVKLTGDPAAPLNVAWAA